MKRNFFNNITLLLIARGDFFSGIRVSCYCLHCERIMLCVHGSSSLMWTWAFRHSTHLECQMRPYRRPRTRLNDQKGNTTTKQHCSWKQMLGFWFQRYVSVRTSQYELPRLASQRMLRVCARVHVRVCEVSSSTRLNSSHRTQHTQMKNSEFSKRNCSSEQTHQAEPD